MRTVGGSRTMSVTMPADLAAQVDAEARGISVSEWLRSAAYIVLIAQRGKHDVRLVKADQVTVDVKYGKAAIEELAELLALVRPTGEVAKEVDQLDGKLERVLYILRREAGRSGVVDDGE